jgi:hypothetical protein
MERKVRLPEVGGTRYGYKSACPVEVEISLTGAAGPDDLSGTRVAISASVWRPNRSDIVQGGQMLEELLELYPGNASVLRLVELWRQWHLNDMHAGCEHQRKSWDTTRKVRVWHWQRDYSDDNVKAAEAAKRAAVRELEATGAAEITEDVRAELVKPWQVTTLTDERPAGYKPSEMSTPATEEKALGWLRPEEHPEGMLAKPCEVCGYKYGTEWRREEVPAEIVRELAAWTFKPGRVAVSS